MDVPRRDLALAGIVAGSCALLLGAMGLLTPAFTDYEIEAEPSIQALRAGDVLGFLEQAPSYGGSLVLRSPFVFLPDLWGGGDLALFRSMAAPCLAAAALLAFVLWRGARRLGCSGATAWIALALVAANPLTLRALEIGHPEEVLGAVFCVAAVLAAGRERVLLAGVLLGLAVANKPWAVLAVVPLLAIAGAGWWRLLGAAGLTGAIVMAPLMVGGGAIEEASHVARNSSTIFQPWQVWWFLGDTGEVVIGPHGEKPGYRVPPGWLPGVSHFLVVLVPTAVGLALLPLLRRRPWHDGLLLLAFAMLLRCVLDPWNVSYYALPFLFALVAWEVHAERRPPVMALAATLLCWITLVSLPEATTPDGQAIAYLAWSLPLAVWMAVRLVAPHRRFVVEAHPGVKVRLPRADLGA
jgi:hypothetical protein